MVIRSLWANFGALNGRELNLKPGLNLITGDNESGKSTWTAFLEAMLYGIDTSRRAKAGVLPEKTLFAPWQGGRMEGKMELTWQGRDLQVVRATPRANAPMQDLTVRDSRTGEEVLALMTPDFGQQLTGVNREVYRRSAFLGRGGLPIGESQDLERRIQSLLTGGDEESSYSQAARRLRDWQNRVARPHTGEISRLEEELQELEEGAGRREALQTRAAGLQEKLKETQASQRAVTARLQLQDAQEAKALWRERRALEGELRELSAALKSEPEPPAEALALLEQALARVRAGLRDLEAAREDLAAAQERLREAEDQAAPYAPFAGLSPEEAWERAGRDAAVLRAGAAKGPRWGLGAGVLGGAALLALLPAAVWKLWWLPLPLLLGAAAVCLWGLARGRSLRDRDARRAELLARYGCRDADGLMDLAAGYRAHCLLLQDRRQGVQAARERESQRAEELEARQKALTARVQILDPQFSPEGDAAALLSTLARRREQRQERVFQLERLQLRLDKLTAQLGDRPEPQEEPAPASPEEALPDRAALAAQAESLRREAASYERELAALQGELRAFPAGEALQERRDKLTAQLRRKTRADEALTAAQAALDRAYAAMQLRFAPELNARAGEYLALLTGGRYREVLVSRQFSPLAVREGTVVPRQPQELSRGTADQIYLALRLAISRMTLPDNPPLVLDDCLTAFDDRRMALALDFFRELAKDQQVLLFSCHTREAEYLRDAPDVHHIHLDREEPHE